MKTLVKSISAIWLFGVFAILQVWFWSAAAEGNAGLMKIVIGVLAFLLVGLAPVKLVRTVYNLFN